MKSILDEVTADLRKIRDAASAADRRLLEEHVTFVREMEAELHELVATAACLLRAAARARHQEHQRQHAEAQPDADRSAGQ